jgi:septum formation protein
MYLLASRSPRRRELLALVVPPEQIIVRPPPDEREAGFEGLHDLGSIRQRLAEIARAKVQAVMVNLPPSPDPEANRSIVIAADTIVVVQDPMVGCRVLGQPPRENWQATVREWFTRHYAGRTHRVLSALCVWRLAAGPEERVVETLVTMRADVDRWLNRYLASGEPLGKAGGYAIQGAGSIFVGRVEGSLSNVTGLPLEALLQLLEQHGLNGNTLTG